MEIIPTFAGADTLFCTCYPEDNNVDILTVLFEKWTDTQYLIDFFTEHIEDLAEPYWNGLSIDEAVGLVLDEVYYLQERLICIDSKNPECKDLKVEDVFKNLNKPGKGNLSEKNFKKGRLDTLPQLLRIYGVQLEDGTMIITGGAIKITKGMEKEHLKKEIRKMHQTREFLKSQLIYTKEGLQ